ncbi:MAG: endonuclease III [Bacillota bacterium]
MEATRSSLATLVRLLRQAHAQKEGPPTLLSDMDGDPLDVLILTVLSQATNDRNAAVAYARLRTRFPSWDQVLDAPVEKLAAAIAPGGLGPQKAARIKEVLRLVAERGTLGLGWLKEQPPGRAMEFLNSLPGVGPKTAACVLLFGLGQPAFPVDTHVARLARRLGLAGPNEPAERIQQRLEGLVEPGDARDLHITLIHHGRTVCHARRPACGRCVLAGVCASREESGGSVQKSMP